MHSLIHYSKKNTNPLFASKALLTNLRIPMKRVQNILLVDDDRDDSELLKEAISEVTPSVAIHIVSSGGEALKLLETLVPDFIFLDINMPGQDGFECLQLIRKRSSFDKLPIAIYSTSGSESQIRKAYNHAANMYIRKPSTFSAIREVIEKVIDLDLDDYVPGPPAYSNFVIA